MLILISIYRCDVFVVIIHDMISAESWYEAPVSWIVPRKAFLVALLVPQTLALVTESLGNESAKLMENKWSSLKPALVHFFLRRNPKVLHKRSGWGTNGHMQYSGIAGIVKSHVGMGQNLSYHIRVWNGMNIHSNQ